VSVLGSGSSLVQLELDRFGNVEPLANTVDVKEFLPHPSSLTVSDVAKDAQGWLVETLATGAAA
jgi:hypothetical protein